MLRKLRTPITLVASGLVLSSACTIKGPPEPTMPADTGGTEGMAEGGSSSGSSSIAGKGGKGGTSGTTGKGGSAGRAGSGNAGKAQVEGGAGGEGPECPGCDSGFCLEDGTCVDCLASNDHCPSGQYCTADHECAPGCKANGSSCASGVCGQDHNCQKCIADEECLPDLVCGNGVCAAACAQAQEGQTTGCSNDLTCCSLHCTDLAVDSQNCGTCGHSCGTAQFCGLTECAPDGAGGAGGAGPNDEACVTCHDTTLANLCAVAKVVVILDTSKNASDGNRVPGRAMGKALEQQCPTKPVLAEAEQDSVEALNFTTGRPVSNGGELLVVAGGPVFQNVEGYLEEHDITPLYWKVNDPVTEYRKTRDDEVVISLPIAGDHESHDLFIIQFTRDAASGSLVLNAQGFWLSGTVAAAYQLTNGILPNLAAADKAWYAYDWTDKDGDKAPDLDEITLLDSGY